MNDDEEPIVTAARTIARALDRLGNADAATPMGGMEALGEHLGNKLGEVAGALHDIESVANALDNVAGALQNIGSVAESLGDVADALNRISLAINQLSDTNGDINIIVKRPS